MKSDHGFTYDLWSFDSNDLQLRRKRLSIGDGNAGRCTNLQELSLLRVVAKDLAGLELVDPAVQFQRVPCEGDGDRRMRAQVLQLDEHVLLNGNIQEPVVRQICVLMQHDLTSSFGMLQPSAQTRH